MKDIQLYGLTLFFYGAILTFLTCELSKNHSTRINVLLIAGAIVVCISMYIYIKNKKVLRGLRMNKEQAIKKIDELKRFVRECEVEEPKKRYYWTYVCENIIHHNNINESEVRGDIVYQDENIIVEHNDFGGTFVRYKNGKKP